MFTARRLKPGAWEQFRRAWDPGDSKPPGFQRAYHARNIRDEDEVVSFGLFDMTKDDYHRWRGEADADENKRVDRLSAYVENEHVSGVFEVVDVVEEGGARPLHAAQADLHHRGQGQGEGAQGEELRAEPRPATRP